MTALVDEITQPPTTDPVIHPTEADIIGWAIRAKDRPRNESVIKYIYQKALEGFHYDGTREPPRIEERIVRVVEKADGWKIAFFCLLSILLFILAVCFLPALL